MTVKIIGLIQLKDINAFEIYRNQVGATVQMFNGQVATRGKVSDIFWNELNAENFSSYVELIFPMLSDAQQWAKSPEYQRLLSVRNQALKVTLFSIQTLD